jgi:cytochrome P450
MIPAVTAPEVAWDATQPPTWDPQARRATLFSYADVRRMLDTDGVTLSQQEHPPAERDRHHPNASFMWSLDGAEHDRQREKLEEPFGRALKGLPPVIEARTNAHLDAIVAQRVGRFDIVQTLGRIPYEIIGSLIGAPLTDADRFLGWLDAAYSSPAAQMPVQEDMQQYFRAHIDRARTNPPPGLLADLLAAGLDDRELLIILWGLYAAGTDTTSTALASLLLLLTTEPGLLDLAAAAPGKRIAAIVEESLRLDPPLALMEPVTALRQVAFDGVVLRPGETMQGWVTTANRDPRAWGDDAHRFRLDRPNRDHLTFGAKDNLHYCLGAPLARLELRTMLRVIMGRLDELPGLRWDPDLPAERRAGVIHRFVSLWMAYG